MDLGRQSPAAALQAEWVGSSLAADLAAAYSSPLPPLWGRVRGRRAGEQTLSAIVTWVVELAAEAAVCYQQASFYATGAPTLWQPRQLQAGPEHRD